jgi:hypothetical protein
MRRLYIEISDSAFDRLGRRATDERRPVRDQAAVELERALTAPSEARPNMDDRQPDDDRMVAADQRAREATR